MTSSNFPVRLAIMQVRLNLFFLGELAMGTPLADIQAGFTEISKDLTALGAFIQSASANTGGLSAADTATVVTGVQNLVKSADALVASLTPATPPAATPPATGA